MTAADRGKSSEDRFQKALDNYAKTDYTFCYERIYDARSSMGKMSNPRTGDFVIYHKGKNLCIEVKEMEHDYRLPCSNFKLDQRARMRVRQLAGSICLVVVYSSLLQTWRIQTLDYFGTQNTGSWDMRDTLTIDLAGVMDIIVNKEPTYVKNTDS